LPPRLSLAAGGSGKRATLFKQAHAGDGAGFLFGLRHGYASAAVTLTP
jgi:hypothetical protein